MAEGEPEATPAVVLRSQGGGSGPSEPAVRAGGGVVRRRRENGDYEYAVVHRPRYDDWSLPKGKVDAGESDEQAALREVEEETGVRGELGPELGTVRYTDRKGRAKHVRYWLMDVARGPSDFRPNQEIDDLRWCSAADAGKLLSYEHDRKLIANAEALG
jgi:8-oxo-dGTP pyrophosphatase MutT (NUDIX family)